MPFGEYQTNKGSSKQSPRNDDKSKLPSLFTFSGAGEDFEHHYDDVE